MKTTTMTTEGMEMRWDSELDVGIDAGTVDGFVVERMDGTFAVGFYPARRVMVAE